MLCVVPANAVTYGPDTARCPRGRSPSEMIPAGVYGFPAFAGTTRGYST
jgi:hypothetical protein